jgi:tetratricopeptide (TPR) repeat protein
MIDSSTLFQLRLEYCQELLNNDQHQIALLEIEEILDEQNECIDALYLAGQTYLLIRDSRSAEHCFKQITTIAYLEDQQAELYLSLALSLFFQYRFSEALEELKNSLRHNSQASLAWRYQAMTQERLGYLKVARNSANRAYTIDPDNNIIPDWNIKDSIGELNATLTEFIKECELTSIAWEDFPQKPKTISRKSISPQQVVYIDTVTCELCIFYGNLKFIAPDIESQIEFLTTEIARVIPTLW